MQNILALTAMQSGMSRSDALAHYPCMDQTIEEYINIAGHHIVRLRCGYYRYANRYYLTRQELAEKITAELAENLLITPAQASAFVKYRLRISISATERSHLAQLRRKIRKQMQRAEALFALDYANIFQGNEC